MNDKFLAVLLTTMLPALSFGQGLQNYECTYGDLQRRVEILSEPGVTVPCEVHYYKDTELPGVRQVLWRATNEAGYCERKTREFIAGLQESGWNCGQDDNAGQETEPEKANDSGQDNQLGQSDDTDVLIPAEEIESTEDGLNAAPESMQKKTN